MDTIWTFPCHGRELGPLSYIAYWQDRGGYLKAFTLYRDNAAMRIRARLGRFWIFLHDSNPPSGSSCLTDNATTHDASLSRRLHAFERLRFFTRLDRTGIRVLGRVDALDLGHGGLGGYFRSLILRADDGWHWFADNDRGKTGCMGCHLDGFEWQPSAGAVSVTDLSCRLPRLSAG